MSVSLGEVLRVLNKILGKYEKEMGIRVYPTARDHFFAPEIEVSDAGVELPAPGLLYKVKVVGEYPVYLNIDRPVGEEYTVVHPGSYYVIPRAGAKLYLKAPPGFKTIVRVEALR
jgi:hypothetical protein